MPAGRQRYFGAKLDGFPIQGFATDKVRALLAYLAVEAGQPHSREQLMGLFWPERSEELAHASLRTALSRLRHALGLNHTGSPFLNISRDAVQLICSSDWWMDVAVFEERIAEAEYDLEHTGDLPSAMTHFQEAISLYRGDFLEVFVLKDCPEFDQ